MTDDKDALIYLADVRINELETDVGMLHELVRDMIAFLAVAQIADVRIHSREHGTWSLDKFRSRAIKLGVEL